MNNKMWKIMQLGVTGNASVTASRVFQFSIVQKDKKPKLYLNLSSAKKEGADFSAKFLRVAEIVK